MLQRDRGALLACTLTAALLLTGCSMTTERSGGRTAATGASGDSSVTLIEQILEDGEITDAELSDITERYRSCLAAAGITFDGQDGDGGTRFSFPHGLSADEANRRANLCGVESGQDAVDTVHDLVRGNNPAAR